MPGLESVVEERFAQSLPAHRTLDGGPKAPASAGIGADVAAGPSMPATHLADALSAFDNEALPAVPDAPEIIAALMQNALILIGHREYLPAMNLLRNILMRSPNHPDGLALLGSCLKETGKHDEALRCALALVERRPNAAGYALLADVYYLMERDHEAMEAYHEALKSMGETGPRLFDVFKNLGNIHVRCGDFDAAEECYNKAYLLDNHSDALMVNYGTLEIQRENFATAVERFRQAVDLNPNNDRGWVGLALVHREMGDFELSRANIERALDINPCNKTALHLLVEWNAVDRDLSGSVCRLQDYLERRGEDAEMSFLLAKILTHLHRLGEAIIELERALALDPEIVGGVQLMSALQVEIRRRSEAAL